MQRFRPLILIAGILTFLAAGWGYVQVKAENEDAVPRFAAVERADLSVFTIATGRMEAIDVVEVSSQLSGQVAELFTDFNDQVVAGEPLARLDDKSYVAAVAEAEARLAHREASHEAAVAETAGTVARHRQADQDHKRTKTLKERGNISARNTDKAEADLLDAKSSLNAARAEEAVQSAAIDMARAALRKARIELDRSVIRAPIDGVVIGRSVELGQTVAVSMEAPTLFTIAQDLHEMRLHARVDEADIGRIRTGQKARFSVDAYPGRDFLGVVLEIHREPQIIQNVVTYAVIVTAENPDLVLLPGMTAVVRIATIERSNALLVPNAALRYLPGPGVDVQKVETSPDDLASGRAGRVWKRAPDDRLHSVAIGVGVSDGSRTEVLAGSLAEGDEVATGELPPDREPTLFGLRLGF